MSAFRIAFRQLVKSPGFAFVATLTLAVGIGSATTAFTAVNAILLRPLPLIQQQEQMVHLTQALPAAGAERAGVCYADFLDWRQRNRTLSAVWAYDHRTVIIGSAGEPIRRMGSGLTAGAFQAMGVQPLLGRDFRPEEEAFGAPAVAILSHELWQSHFGGEAEVLGRSVVLNGEPTTIVGVMPPGWRYPELADLWLPLRRNPAEVMRGAFDLAAHGMLRPGVSLASAQEEFAAISAALAAEHPLTNAGVVAHVRPVREEVIADVAQLTLLVFGAVMFVFLIACANVANLLLARASVRTREIALRMALGAQRAQLVRQLLLESLLLAAFGAVGGFILALWGVDLMLAAIPNELPFWLRFEIDYRVFSFIAALAMLSSVLFGLMPALQTTRPDVIEELKESSRASSSGARTHRLRNALVIAEIALALVLLVGAGLMMRSFLLLNRVAPGFDPHQVLTFRVGFPPAMVATKDTKEVVPRRFFADLLPRLTALNGVESAAAISTLPGIGQGNFAGVVLEGEPEPSSLTQFQPAFIRVITPAAFDTLRIPLRAGRAFTATDDPDRPAVAIVDEIFVRRFFPNQDPIGKRFRPFDKKEEDTPVKWLEIVGVVGVARRFLDREEPHGTFYIPHAQSPINFMTVVLRTRGEPETWIAPARAEVLAVNRGIPIYNAMSLERAMERSESIWKRRFFGSLFTAFAGIALLLASVGIYAVMAYSVAQRIPEIGVRMALGAQPDEVVRMVLRRGIRLVGAGLGLGFVAAFFTAELLAGNLYGVSPHDPPTFAAVPALLAAVAMLACYLPSRRATLVNPNVALRME